MREIYIPDTPELNGRFAMIDLTNRETLAEFKTRILAERFARFWTSPKVKPEERAYWLEIASLKGFRSSWIPRHRDGA